MIDYLKIYTKEKEIISRLNDNNLLTWYGEREKLSHIEKEAEEGIIKAETTKIYKGIVFCFKEDSLLIYFKPHYYFNDNKHNANDFTVNNFLKVLGEVLEELQIKDLAERLFIINIEYGVNLLSPIKIEDLIAFIAYHKKNEFRTDSGLLYSKKSQSISSNGKASRYQIIKAYAKGIQFPQYAAHNTLRFEIKSQESRKIKSLGISSIKDLLEPETFKTLEDDLKGRFNEILILDSSVDLSKLDQKSRFKLIERLNSHYWYRQQQKTRNTFSNSKKTYFKLLDKTGYNIHLELKKILISKLNDLKYCANTDTLNNSKNCAFSDIYIMRNCTTKGGLISPEQQSKFLSKSQREKVRAEIKNYAVDLFKKNVDRYLKVHSYKRGEVSEDRAEKLVKVTIRETKKKFRNEYENYNLTNWEGKYFICPLGSSVDWGKELLVSYFERQFYQKNNEQFKRRGKILRDQVIS